MKEKLLIYLTMALIVPIAGEMKFFPFAGDVRVSLGTPVFFFFLLWSRRTNGIVSGLLVGASVVVFRVVLLKLFSDSFVLEDAFMQHFPVFFYYFTFALMFHFFQVQRYYNNPIFIGLFGVVAEISATLIEIYLRSFVNHIPFTASSFIMIVGIAFIRSFFVLGFFNIFIIRETRLAEEQQRKRNVEMLTMISNLYVESIQLNKSMKNAEELTGSCYHFYRELKEKGLEAEAKTALKISGQMHEIKKDSQRIYAGLSKLMDKDHLKDFMGIQEILDVAVIGNQHYGHMLKKNISYTVHVDGEHPNYHAVILLSLMNNLISNAVEAIENIGEIRISVENSEETVSFFIEDNGVGIPERSRKLIFEPGFTTKYNHSGVASNGIGLSYVKEIIENMGGTISLEPCSSIFKTKFQFSLPILTLTERG